MGIMAEQLLELKLLSEENGGILQPEYVVQFAKDESTALHSAFEWDDSEAANKYRLHQARQLIQVMVEIIPVDNKPIKVQAFVSLKNDRYDEGGYKYFPQLMQTKQGRAKILETALWELSAFEKKYSHLTELSELFKTIKKIRKSFNGN